MEKWNLIDDYYLRLNCFSKRNFKIKRTNKLRKYDFSNGFSWFKNVITYFFKIRPLNGILTLS